jgi:hypothetical protein
MPKPGRNDPCPCGSGRKYKRCCLGHEAEHDAYAAALERSVLPLLSDLARFAEAATRQPLEAVARKDFPFWRGPLDDAMAARVVDHLMFDLRHERFGRTAIDQYVLERANALSEQSRALLKAWQGATQRLYRVESWSAGFLQCTDLLGDASGSISVWPLGRNAGLVAEGSPVALRALATNSDPDAHDVRFVCLGRPTQFGQRSAEQVAAAIRQRHLDFVRSKRIVGIDEFLRIAPTVLDEEAAAAGAPTSGIILPGA